MKQITIKMNEKEIQTFKEARVQAIIEGKRVGTFVAEAIEEKIKHDDKLNS